MELRKLKLQKTDSTVIQLSLDIEKQFGARSLGARICKDEIELEFDRDISKENLEAIKNLIKLQLPDFGIKNVWVA